MIGYYVHHVGAGHATRATAVAAAYRRLTGQEVVGLSSRPRPADWVGDWVELADDTEGLGDAVDHEATAGGVLHHAPLHAAGFGERQRQIAAWVTAHHPAAVVVDVSVEVTALVRLLGVPVVVVAMPGDRTDAPHRAGYGLASAVVACWPPGAHPDHVVAHGDLADRTRCVGGVSRLSAPPRERGAPTTPDAPDPTPATAPRRDPLGVVLWGHGSDAPGAGELDLLHRAAPDLEWVLARDRPADEVRDLLQRAALVVTHAGQGAVADVATAGAPAVVLAQPRPHDEQEATARALTRLGLAATATGWPGAADWPGLVAEARRLGGDGWSRWLGPGAAGIAATVDRVATTGADHRPHRSTP
ncbi:glycosyltransferase [Kytococcus sp. Marseille-QA3725]